MVVLDLAPSRVVDLAGERLPKRVARAYRRYLHGPGAFKVTVAGRRLDQRGLPPGGDARGGTSEEVVVAERDVNRGRMPERPFKLVAQQYLADPGRSNGEIHPVWSYAHVPNGYTGDAEEALIDQIERFAPGFRERIVHGPHAPPPTWPPPTRTVSRRPSSPAPTRRCGC